MPGLRSLTGKKGGWADNTAASASAAGTTRRATYLLELGRWVTRDGKVERVEAPAVSDWDTAVCNPAPAEGDASWAPGGKRLEQPARCGMNRGTPFSDIAPGCAVSVRSCVQS